MSEFLTSEQQAVVEYRIALGYEFQKLANGFYKVWKGRHTMVINGLGYDTYVKLGMAN